MNRSVSICVFACALLALSLTPALAQPAPDTSRDVVLFTGTSYNHTGSPKLTADLGAFYQIGEKDYVGVVADLAFKRNQQPTITMRPEYARQFASIGKLPLYALAGIGAEFAASDPAAVIQQLKAALSNVGTNVGYSAATGVTTNFPIGHGLYVIPAFRVVKGSLNDTAYVLGINIGGKVKVSQK